MGCGGSTAIQAVETTKTEENGNTVSYKSQNKYYNNPYQSQEEDMTRQQEIARQQEMAQQQEMARQQKMARQQEMAQQQELQRQQELQKQQGVQQQQQEQQQEGEEIFIPSNVVDKYDPNLPHYNIKELSEHNSKCHYMDLFRFHQMVCSSQKFKEVMEPVVREFEANTDPDNDDEPFDFNENFGGHPVFIIWLVVGLKMTTIRNYLGQCKIGQFKQLSEQEEIEDLKSDVDKICLDLDNSDISDYLREYKELLERFLAKTLTPGYTFKNKLPVEGDPNENPFMLPAGISENPKVLRFWIESWETFDFEVPEGGSWSMYDLNMVFDGSEETEQEQEEEKEELPEFDFEIDGDVAWQVMDVDIVKNDVTTDEQNKIWELREKRTGLNDPVKMKRRREKLEKYFIDKYEWDASKLDPFKGFADLLQSQWDEFQKLCETD